MIVKARQIVTDLLFIILILNFSPLNESLGGRLYIPLILCLLVAVIFEHSTYQILIFIKGIILYVILSLIILIIGGNLFSEYSQIYTLETMIVIYCMLFLATCNYQYITKIDWLYVVGLAVILYNIVVSAITNSPVLILYEQNMSGILVYLFFLYCYKKKHVLGIIIGIVFGVVFTDSRSYALLLLLFFLILFLKRKIPVVMKKVSKVKLFYAIIILTVLSIGISFFWVLVIAKNGYGGYHSSFNDNSNYVHATSIIYGLNVFSSDYPRILFGGYGLRLKEFMGIDTQAGFYTQYMGNRLVQAHSSVINMVLCMGLFQTIIYCILLSKVIHEYDIYDNLEYIYPFLLNAMFMHAMLNLRWAILWIIIIALPKSENQRFNIHFVRRKQ